ncbi:hypothetical protein ACFPER_05095 [Agromyces aurantiacus]|uniref:Uncharacterized protein n=1 Tax=Agromyces aurantiacus TaxID=165814 RepID=A0ABV9R3X8_9MICO|nr:hypothetical protein [Agromyces aurantiacus]MBM7502836.1 hypothetical protein [Agromyces aurantiacus]
MFGEWRQLIEFLQVLATPVLGHGTDALLVTLGIALVLLFAVAIAAVLASSMAGRPIPLPARGGGRRRARQARTLPPGARRPRFSARPRAPGAALA